MKKKLTFYLLNVSYEIIIFFLPIFLVKEIYFWKNWGYLSKIISKKSVLLKLNSVKSDYDKEKSNLFRPSQTRIHTTLHQNLANYETHERLNTPAITSKPKPIFRSQQQPWTVVKRFFFSLFLQTILLLHIMCLFASSK